MKDFWNVVEVDSVNNNENKKIEIYEAYFKLYDSDENYKEELPRKVLTFCVLYED